VIADSSEPGVTPPRKDQPHLHHVQVEVRPEYPNPLKVITPARAGRRIPPDSRDDRRAPDQDHGAHTAPCCVISAGCRALADQESAALRFRTSTGVHRYGSPSCVYLRGPCWMWVNCNSKCNWRGSVGGHGRVNLIWPHLLRPPGIPPSPSSSSWPAARMLDRRRCGADAPRAGASYVPALCPELSPLTP
jgi:hypothetical protein